MDHTTSYDSTGHASYRSLTSAKTPGSNRRLYPSGRFHLPPLCGTRKGGNGFADPHADASLSASAVVVARRFAAHSSRSDLR